MIFAYLFFLIPVFTVLTANGQEITGLETVLVEDVRDQYPLNYPYAFTSTLNLKEFEGEYKSSAEILSFAPGVVVRDFGGFGQLKTISIRGSSSDQVVILLDGIRLNSPLSGGVDLSTIPVEYVESIDVIRGGGSAFVGSDALGGVVNITTRSSVDPFTMGSVTYGSFNTLSATFSRAHKLGDLGYFFSYNHSRSDGDFKFRSVNNQTLRRINNQFETHSLLFKIDYDLGGADISFLNEFFYSDRGVPGLGEFQEDTSRQKDLRNLTSFVVSKQGFVRSDIDIRATVYHKFDRLRFTDPEPLLGVPIDTDSRILNPGLSSEIIWHISDRYILTISPEIRYEKLDDEDFSNPSRTNIGMFIGNDLHFLDRRLRINPLIRFDYYTTRGKENSSDFGFSPKLGAIYSLTDNLFIKGNLSYSHRIPNFSELFFPDQGFIGGNPDLKQEKAFDLDIGFSYHRSNFVFDINYFRRDIRNSILFVFISAQRIEPRNVGDVIQQGVETSIIYKPFEFMDIFAGYTYLDGEIEETGAQLPGKPANKFDLRVVLKRSFASVFFETHFVDSIPLTPFRGSRTTEPRVVHDAGIKVNFERYFFSLEAKNLLDNLDVRDAFDFPLPGRTFYFTAGIKYH